MNDKQNARIVYADIINLPHFQSQKRPHMSLYDRAAQFAPFAALTGFDDMVTEEARLTDKPIELSEIELETLNRKMDLLELLLQELILYGSDDIENKKIPTIDLQLDRIIDISGFPTEFDEYEN